MKTLFKMIMAGVFASTLILTPSAQAAPKLLKVDKAKAAVIAAAEAGRPMTVNEIYKVFSGRSWIWDNGAGYFAVSKRDFTAWSGRGKKATYAKGSWFIASGGRLCFNATWYAMNGAGKKVTCFENRKNGKKMYQRRLPDGEWYVFSHTPPYSYDAIRKLKRGDYVARRLARNERYITKNMPEIDECAYYEVGKRFICNMFK
ncbi:DUF995 domain-containing protein [Breoghania sp.]|uniref:DUF995 domain-containing protein n=1 Tax=Breoghania sp. TaxID=2065378 RepID=UPI002AA76172|nr:DUF995 domain-containing protein [Breoghania sp.]